MSTGARSPSRAPGWPAGQPSKRCNASAPDPAGEGQRPGRRAPRPQHRRGRRRPRACLPGLLRAARRPHPPPGHMTLTGPRLARVAQVMTPIAMAWSPHLIAPDQPLKRLCRAAPCLPGEGMTGSPRVVCPGWDTAVDTDTTNLEHQSQELNQRLPRHRPVRTRRRRRQGTRGFAGALRSRLDPAASTRRAQHQAEASEQHPPPTETA